jgi:hypothetical protein
VRVRRGGLDPAELRGKEFPFSFSFSFSFSISISISLISFFF